MNIDLVTLGPAHTFSSLAAMQYRSDTEPFLAETIEEVFEMVENGQAKEGLVPIENRHSGSVGETLEQLFNHDLFIKSAITIPIHHCLAALFGSSMKDLKKIYSHPQALKQCRQYLKKEFSTVKKVPMASTIEALERLIEEGKMDVAVICSKGAAAAYPVELLVSEIEDDPKNATRFIVITKKKPDSSVTNLTGTIAFSFDADAPGSLYEVLGEFAGAGVNMTKIESLNNPRAPGGHVFYIDFEGRFDDSNIQKMLSAIRGHVKVLKVLGSY